MQPDQFSDKSPGRLVRASFERYRTVRGIPELVTVSGWAFLPDPPPAFLAIAHHLPRITKLLEETTATLGRLDGFFEQSPGGFNVDPWVLLNPLRVREARLSSKIENTVASAEEIGLAEVSRPERHEPVEVLNYLRAIEQAMAHKRPLLESEIRALHAMLLSEIPDSERKYPGEYRPGQVFLGDEHLGFEKARFVPPPPTEVAKLMAQLVEFTQEESADMPILIAAAIAHYQFETIHPFADGNGRLGRMLITLSLCQNSLLKEPLIYPSGYIDQTKQRYYDTLLRVSTHGAWTEWFEYFLTAVHIEAKGTLERLRRLMALREDFLGRVQSRSFTMKFHETIDLIFERYIVSAPWIQKRIGVTDQTARNYIAIMKDKGILRSLPKMGKRMYYIADEVSSVADEG